MISRSPTSPELTLTPAQMGYAMPAEWGPHAATWISWPHRRADWPGKFEPMAWAFAEIVRHVAGGELVNILVAPSRGDRSQVAVDDKLSRAGVNMANVRLHAVPTDRAWIRDSGPIFVTRSKKREAGSTKNAAGREAVLIDFKFNAWAKDDISKKDDAIPAAVEGILGLPRREAYGANNAGEFQRFVLEGGSIDVNGEGDLITTEECLLSKIQQRNPGFSRGRIEDTLRAYLGVERIHWLGRGIVGDDTHGHVDDTARFINRDTIAVCVETHPRDVNFSATQDNLRRAARLRDGRGRRFTIVELPMPGPVTFNGMRLPASYANFYIANAGILVPVFNDPADARALRLFEGLFPGRPILPLYCRDIVWGLGTIHCLTQQQPA